MRRALSLAAILAAPGPLYLAAQPIAAQLAAASTPALTSLCVIPFDKNKRLPARVDDTAQPCLLRARQTLAANSDLNLYLVATADKVKDNAVSHGHERTEQDMTGEDLRYADVAAYRAINTKAYLVRWLHLDPARVVPLTAYNDGQSVALYAVSKQISFKKSYGKPTAPILSVPCTVKPCAMGPEEFLIPQQRDKIPVR